MLASEQNRPWPRKTTPLLSGTYDVPSGLGRQTEWSKFSRTVSQKHQFACSINVNVANEGIVEMSFDEAGPDLETVFRAQYERIARIIAGVIRDPARAEELAVDVFLKWE